MAPDALPPGHLRIGHSEREVVVTLLQEAAGGGRLTMDELDLRLEAALRSKTYADLDSLVADLAVELPWRKQTTQPQRAYGPPAAGYSREDPLRLNGGMSSETRQGRWTVPPFIQINPGMGSVKLNCLEASPAAPVIEIEMVAGAGSVLLVLPDGWAVDADRLYKTWGSKALKVPREPAPGRPLLVIYGTVGLGSLKVRPANGMERRRLERGGGHPQLGH